MLFYFIFEELTSSIDTFSRFNFKVSRRMYIQNTFTPKQYFIRNV